MAGHCKQQSQSTVSSFCQDTVFYQAGNVQITTCLHFLRLKYCSMHQYILPVTKIRKPFNISNLKNLYGKNVHF